jgi:hypothetical protein
MQLFADEHLGSRVMLDCDVLPTYFALSSYNEITECNNKFVHPLFPIIRSFSICPNCMYVGVF